MAVKIQIRGDTGAAWTAANPVLAERELAIETDTQRFKVGDGATAWNALPYMVVAQQSVEQINVAISAGTLTLDINLKYERNFDLTTTASAAFAIVFLNTTVWIRSRLTLRITGSVAITLPANVIMPRHEEVSGRWNSTTNILTVTGVTDSPFLIEFEKDAVGNVWCFCSERGV